MRTLDDYEDFKNLADFIEKFPGALDQREIAVVRQDFKEFSNDYANLSERDTTLLRDTAKEIETVGEKLGVNVTHLVDRLLERADEIESEGEREPEPDYSDRGWVEDLQGVREVDAMFEGLLREIEERAK